MKYHSANPVEARAARNRLYYLLSKKRVVEIKEIRPKRTLPQNAYLHLLLAAFGVHFGYELEEAKLIYKEASRATYFYKKKGRTFIRSSADLTKEEMALTIDRFRAKSAEAGCELPLATDQEWLMSIENEIERNRRYL